MPAYIEELAARVEAVLGSRVKRYASREQEFAIEVEVADLLEVARTLRDEPQLRFEMLMDLAGVDYLDQTALRYRVFADVWAVRSLLLRKPTLPALEREVDYRFRVED